MPTIGGRSVWVEGPIKARTIPAGTTLEAHADCPSFAEEVRKWCDDTGKVLISIVDCGAFNVATVQL